MRSSTRAVDIDELLRIGGPSIEYRTRHEVLGEEPESCGMVKLQRAIVEDPVVQGVLSWSRPDGWLGNTFHGRNGIEAGIRILCEKGLSRRHPVLSKALDALEVGDARLHQGIGRVGRALDEAGLGGSEMIRAAVFAYAADEQRACVRAQIAEALRGFESVLAVGSVDEITEQYGGRRIFRKGVRWPSVYHLRLLAYTRSWRTSERIGKLARAVERLVELSPVPEIYLRRGSQLMVPASFAMGDFAANLGETEGYGRMLWFQRAELLARLGVVPFVPALRAQVGHLAEALEDGLFRQRANHPSFKTWGTYAGLALERDWRAASRRTADLTFRALLILHYATA